MKKHVLNVFTIIGLDSRIMFIPPLMNDQFDDMTTNHTSFLRRVTHYFEVKDYCACITKEIFLYEEMLPRH